MREFILLIISVILLIVTIILLKKCHLIKYTYYNYDDEGVIKHMHKSKKQKDYVIENNGKSNIYIKRYAIKKIKKGSLICEYTTCFRSITYNVYYRDKKGIILDCLQVKEEFTKEHSNVIPLPKYCYTVSFQVLEVNGEILEDTNLNKELKKQNVFFFALLKGIRFFSFLIIIRFLLIFIFFEDDLLNYYDSDFSQETLICTIIVSLLKFGLDLFLLFTQAKKKVGVEIEKI